jgi:preprotein translocase subunit SecA
MLNLLKKVFGTKQDKDIKLLTPIVEEINEHYEKLNSLSDDELKAKTQEFKQIIKEASQDLEVEKEKLRKVLRDEALDVIQITDTRDRLKQIEKELFKVINDTLDDIMPEAFAVVKQACRRLKDEGFSYEYAGNKVRWEMVPYDVQLMGGVVLHQGRIAEMATGEGKTLVAVLPLYLNALAGKGAHLVTVNDYLAERDADWMRPVYEYLGLSVAAIKSNMEPYTRRKLYGADITYGTNNEFGFDYLRDNMVVDPEHMVQREHWYSIVDEVDSVLIDEARTPLIISGPVGQSTDQKFDEMNPRVRRLVDAQTRLVNQMVSEAEHLLKSGKDEDREKAGILLLRAYHGLPKHKRLAKVLQEPEYQKLKHETEMFFLKDKGSRMHEIDDELYYVVEEKNHQIDMTDIGRELITSGGEDPEMFVLPDIAAVMSELEGNEEIEIDEKQRKIDEINLLYAERSDRIHTVNQLLRAYSLYEKDVEYVVQEGKVMIVDEHTGRILEGRRYSEGLHQAIEAKEHVKVERDTQTMATITLQNYFRLYHKLAGMTGTADTEAAEFEKIYKLDVVVVPTNRPIVRDDRDDLIFRTKREKYNALVDEVEKEIKMGRAVLLGTASVEVSETLSKIFKRRGFKHNVLNAKQHAREADIVANAGKKGALTIATNMAGRGTDIKLDHDVRKNGGLAIIGSERHDARRIDRQLRGRAGRQGDPGSSQFFISLEDNLMRLFGGERVSGIMQKLNIPEGEPIQHSMITKNVERAQKKVEENNFGIRKRLLEYDDVMNQQREVIYARRKNALLGERLKGDIFEYIDELVDEWYQIYQPESDLKGFRNQVRTILLSDPNITEEEFEKESLDKIKDKVIAAADAFYKRKEEMLGSEFMSKLETIGVLQTIDEKWKDHLRVMDDLKEGIHLRSYGQKDPLLEYKGEAFKLFVELIKEINREATLFVFKFFPKIVEREVHQKGKAPKDSRKFDDSIPQLRRRQTTEMQSLQFSQPSVNPSFINNAAQQGLPEQQEATGPSGKPLTHKRSIPKVGRNDLCPCGSGKKYKHCHGR